MARRGRTSARPPVVLAGLAAAATATLWACTTAGPGLTPDSAVYLCAARNLAAGRGLATYWDAGWRPATAGAPTVALTVHPPLFPVTLGGMAALGFNPVQGCRILNGVLFGGNIFLLGALVWAWTRRLGFALWAQLLAFGSGAWFAVHAMVWTEPLFITWGLVAALAATRYVKERRGGALVLAGVAAALATTTRYAGIVVAAALAVAVGAGVEGRRRKGWLAATVVVGPSLITLGAWAARTRVLTGGWSNGGIRPAFHPVTFDHVKLLIDGMASWFVPLAGPPVLKIVVAAALAAAAVGALAAGRNRRWWEAVARRLRRRGVIAAAATFLAAYIAFVFLSLSWADADLPVDGRLLAPAFVGAVVLVAGFLAAMATGARRAATTALTFVAVVEFALVAGNVARVAREVKAGGAVLLYGSRAWQRSPTAASLQRLPAAATIYSNAPDAVYLLAGRAAALLPRKYNRFAGGVNADYGRELARFEGGPATGVFVAYFRQARWMWDVPSERELASSLSLLAASDDGALYRLRGGGR